MRGIPHTHRHMVSNTTHMASHKNPCLTCTKIPTDQKKARGTAASRAVRPAGSVTGPVEERFLRVALTMFLPSLGE